MFKDGWGLSWITIKKTGFLELMSQAAKPAKKS
jgi:hypothetical protein